ncbi:hypothetical protein [Agrobacterium sp. lyk4-40-TYG-31]|uniref:hypothetical protein n=1 Tax=Agrobacterium sp. lyk4-40-TYG-31 TaxID=3040276 RepID=UPI00254A2292|nr:hypothetical protein [Agrobacterium sp. lyk4-40-TYG-31]
MRREPYKATFYTPPPYNGDGLEVIANLPASLSPSVADAVARWHERRHTSHNRVIASALRALVPANDNSGRR